MKTDVFYFNSMNSMVTYLENYGFEVDKKYLSAEKKYEFSITRGTKTIIDYFVYPEKDGSNRAMIMKEFCDYLIHNFEINFGDPIARRNPTCYDPTIDLTSFIPTITKVIFNDPATIVFWSDGTKTVVKTQNGETFDPEKGLAMSIAKRAFGNKGNYYNHISKWVDKYNEEHEAVRDIRSARLSTSEDSKPMTCREKLQKDHPENIIPGMMGGCYGCPDQYRYATWGSGLCREGGKRVAPSNNMCTKCWDRVVQNENE